MISELVPPCSMVVESPEKGDSAASELKVPKSHHIFLSKAKQRPSVSIGYHPYVLPG